MAEHRKSVVVTGASTGIGLACAERFALAGWRVFAGVRRPEDAARLEKTLGSNVRALTMDVTEAGTLAEAASAVREDLAGKRLTGLVNNAGIAVAGPLLHVTADELAHQMDVNVTGVLRASQAFAPQLGTATALDGPPGRIVMISSVAGRVALPLMGPYAASKHALEGLTQALRRELMMYGIDVVAINPGPVATPIWDKAGAEDVSRYDGTDYGPLVRQVMGYAVKRGREGLPPERIALAVDAALTDARPKLNRTLTPEPIMSGLLARLPGRWSDALIARRLGLKPQQGDL